MDFLKHRADLQECKNIYTALTNSDLCKKVDIYIIQEIAVFATGKLIDCRNVCKKQSFLKLQEKKYHDEYVEDWVNRTFCAGCCGDHWPFLEGNMRSCHGENCINYVWQPWIKSHPDYGDLKVWYCSKCHIVYCGYCVLKYTNSGIRFCSTKELVSAENKSVDDNVNNEPPAKKQKMTTQFICYCYQFKINQATFDIILLNQDSTYQYDSK
jgi:hypothetical protein